MKKWQSAPNDFFFENNNLTPLLLPLQYGNQSDHGKRINKKFLPTTSPPLKWKFVLCRGLWVMNDSAFAYD